MKYIALILGLTLPVTLLSCAKAEAQTARQNVEFDSLEEKIAALEAQLGANLKYEKDDDGNERWYDSKGNLIHEKSSDGYGWLYEYDSKGNKTHEKNSYGYEKWYEYDSKGNLIHYKDSDGAEEWYEYDSNGNRIHYKHRENLYEYEYEEWCKYDSDGNKIYTKQYYNEYGREMWWDSNEKIIHEKLSDGTETLCEYDHSYGPLNASFYNPILYEKTSDGTELFYRPYDDGGFDRQNARVYNRQNQLIGVIYGGATGTFADIYEYWGNGNLKQEYGGLNGRDGESSLSYNIDGKLTYYHPKEGGHYLDYLTDSYLFVQYKNGRAFRALELYVDDNLNPDLRSQWMQNHMNPIYSACAYEILYDKSGKIALVKKWSNKNVNDWLMSSTKKEDAVSSRDALYEKLMSSDPTEFYDCFYSDGIHPKTNEAFKWDSENNVTFLTWPPFRNDGTEYKETTPLEDRSVNLLVDRIDRNGSWNIE